MGRLAFLARVFLPDMFLPVAATQELPAPAQCLFLRLLQRRRAWFRLGALDYAEVPDAPAAAADLTAHGFARTSEDPSPEGASCASCVQSLHTPLILVLSKQAGLHGRTGKLCN